MFALDPCNKNLLGLSIIRSRSALECLLTFRYWFKCWGSKPRVVVSDADPWYSILSRLRLNHLVVRGDIKSYVERFNASLKTYVGFTLFSTVLVLFELVMVAITSQVFLLSLCFIITSFAPTRALDTPLNLFLPRRWYKNETSPQEKVIRIFIYI